uniref:Lectin subunit alpha n=2 Tax=Lygus hesperus TaxID=30085 RepID=A0A0A9Y7L1_LYGHE
MELATIRNKEDHNRILEVIKKLGMENGEKSRMFWIGGTKLHSSRGFFWMSDGDQVSYTNWLNGQPDDYDQSQKCMAYQHGWMNDIRWAWDDNFCSSALSFACEYC